GGTVNDAGAYNITGTTASSTAGSGGAANLSGPLTNLGSAIVASAGALNFTGAVPGGAYSFTGITISGGTVNFSTGAALTTGTLTMSGSGTLTGSDALTVSGAMNWTGGTISGSGALNAQGGLTLGAAGAFDFETLTGRTLNN